MFESINENEDVDEPSHHSSNSGKKPQKLEEKRQPHKEHKEKGEQRLGLWGFPRGSGGHEEI